MSEFTFDEAGFRQMHEAVVALGAGERAVAGMIVHDKTTSYALYGVTMEPPTVTQMVRTTGGRPMTQVTRVSLFEDGEPVVAVGFSKDLIEGDPQSAYEWVGVTTPTREPEDYDTHVAIYEGVGRNVQAFMPDMTQTS